MMNNPLGDRIRRVEKRFRTLAKVLPAGLIHTDIAGNCLYVNQRWCAMSGLSYEDSLGTGWSSALVSLLAPSFANQSVLAAENGTVFQAEYLLRRPSGETSWVYLQSTCSVDENRKVTGLVASVIDISEVKNTEQALRQSEALYRALVESCPDGVALIHADGIFEMVNKQFAHNHGYDSPEQMLAAPITIFDLIIPEEYERACLDVQRMIDERCVRNVEYTLRRKDGTLAPGEVSASVVLGSDGSYVGYIGMERDISERKSLDNERKNLEAQLRHAQKMESLGILAGGIAHDFNNLLTSMLGNISLLQMVLAQDSPARAYVRNVDIAARRAAALSNQMLAYSGKGNFVIESVDLNAVVQEMSCLLEATISKKIRLQYDLAKKIPLVAADVTQVRQVIMNLLTNASEAIGDESGEIRITSGTVDCTESYLAKTHANSTSVPGVFVRLDIWDTGCGMDETTIARIFDPFFTTKFTGRGLGLSAVLGIVRGHGGALDVRSEVGKGTLFRILLPASLTLPASQRPYASNGTARWEGGGLILLVDDEDVVRDVAKRLLETAGFSVVAASNGREAVERFRSQPDDFVCVLLDFKMPEMDGEETFAELQRVRSDVPVILSSGYNEQDAIARLIGKGLAGFIHKPYDYAQLLGKLSDVLCTPVSVSPS